MDGFFIFSGPDLIGLEVGVSEEIHLGTIGIVQDITIRLPGTTIAMA